jgi:uncharacterized protein (TIGR02594 family)
VSLQQMGTTMQQPAWLGYAWPEAGVREVAGKGSNGRIAAFFRDAGHPAITSDETAWCAAFVGACLVRSGIKGTGSLLARSYLEWGAAIDEPRLGAIAVLSRGRDPGQGHVGFVVGETPRALVLLGGNQSDAVTVEAFDRSTVLGLRWPSPEKVMVGGEADRAAPASFDRALAHVLEMEGGWTEDPYDPGGPTNQGITLGVFAAWKGVTLDAVNAAGLKEELRRIAPETVRAIYLKRYWEPSRAAELGVALGFMHFDTSVNHGVGAAARMLQEASGATVDGEIGPETLARVAAGSVGELIGRYGEIRRARYRALPHFWRFGRGWLRRADLTEQRARALAGATATLDTTSNDSKGATRMQTETSTQPVPKWWGQSMTIWGAIVTALATVVPALGPVVGIDITGEVIRQAGGQAAQVFQAVAGLIGTALTIWGRVRATQPLQQRDVTFKF